MPLNQELFQSSGYEPSVAHISWQLLPPVVRVLMSADGTVTKSLEAYFWEPIEVVRVSQSDSTQEQSLQEKFRQQESRSLSDCRDFSTAEPLWNRQVELKGAHSQRVYVQASSLIAYTRLPSALREKLSCGSLGIGGLVRELNLETYREIVAVGQIPEKSPRDAVPPTKAWRTYRLHHHGQVLIEITETFLLASFVAAY